MLKYVHFCTWKDRQKARQIIGERNGIHIEMANSTTFLFEPFKSKDAMEQEAASAV